MTTPQRDTPSEFGAPTPEEVSSAYATPGMHEFSRGNLFRAERMFRRSLRIEKEIDRKEGIASA